MRSFARFQRITVSGSWDAARQFLLDNRSHDELPGYEVLTPLQLVDGRVLLVDRGWVPFTGSRAQLPPITIAGTAPVSLSGRLDNLPVAGLAFGRAAPTTDAVWPKVTNYPTYEQLAKSLGGEVQPWMLLLDPRSPDGYVRDWQPPGLAPLGHFSYAFQWWGFALTLVILWGVLSARRRGPKT